MSIFAYALHSINSSYYLIIILTMNLLSSKRCSESSSHYNPTDQTAMPSKPSINKIPSENHNLHREIGIPLGVLLVGILFTGFVFFRKCSKSFCTVLKQQHLIYSYFIFLYPERRSQRLEGAGPPSPSSANTWHTRTNDPF